MEQNEEQSCASFFSHFVKQNHSYPPSSSLTQDRIILSFHVLSTTCVLEPPVKESRGTQCAGEDLFGNNRWVLDCDLAASTPTISFDQDPAKSAREWITQCSASFAATVDL